MANEYDLIVIGTGLAGSAAAFKCKKAGMSVAIIDQRPFGGTCPLRGCDPKKVLVGAAEIIDRSLIMQGNGIYEGIKIHWPDLMAFKKTFTEPYPKAQEKRFADAGIVAFHGPAHFSGPQTVEVNGQTLTGKKIVIATGAKPMKLNIPGEEYITTSEQFLELESLPKDIVFIGGGYISFELGHVAARAGAKVKILHRSSKALNKFDQDLVGKLIEATKDVGIDVRLNTPVTSIEKQDNKFIVHTKTPNNETFECAMVVHGAGRVPDIDDLALEKAGIQVGDKGILANRYLQCSTNHSVYVAGDANAYGMPLTPVATYEGELVATNILENNNAMPDYSVVPSVVFTTPTLASVGMKEEDATQLHMNYRVNFEDTTEWYSSRRINQRHTAFKVLIDKDSSRIIGAHVLGHNAEELINLFALAIRMEVKLFQLNNILWAYPTNSSEITAMIK